MPKHDYPQTNALTGLSRIAVGLGTIAAAAIAAGSLASRKRPAKPDLRAGSRSLNDILRTKPTRRRKPPEAGIAVPAVPPKGPLPKQGGAEAPLDFDV